MYNVCVHVAPLSPPSLSVSLSLPLSLSVYLSRSLSVSQPIERTYRIKPCTRRRCHGNRSYGISCSWSTANYCCFWLHGNRCHGILCNNRLLHTPHVPRLYVLYRFSIDFCSAVFHELISPNLYTIHDNTQSASQVNSFSAELVTEGGHRETKRQRERERLVWLALTRIIHVLQKATITFSHLLMDFAPHQHRTLMKK